MSQFQAHWTAYDMLDQVHLTVRLFRYDGLESAGSLVLQESTTIRGTGEDDPREWLRDALVALLESI